MRKNNYIVASFFPGHGVVKL